MRLALLLAVALGVASAVGARGDEARLDAGEDASNPFFQSLGTNGRACASCHEPGDGWTVTPRRLQARFDASDGLDPIFRAVDAANCPTADLSTIDARRRAFSLLLGRGLIRVTLPVPPGAEFTVLAVDNPYGCSSPTELSVYRRPLPVMNFRVLSRVMWDGRHTRPGRAIEDDLAAQATDATLAHGEAARAPTEMQVRQIIAFQRELSRRRWKPISTGDPETVAAVMRGESIFKTRIILINGVPGFNDDRGAPFVVGSCMTCHDTPAGRRSETALLNLGVNDASRRTPDLPLFTLRCNATGEIVTTLDPGRALITGACRDIGKIKEPILRGLAARAPYFHNGSAATLMDVVDFYDIRFQIKLSPRERADLAAFLSTL